MSLKFKYSARSQNNIKTGTDEDNDVSKCVNRSDTSSLESGRSIGFGFSAGFQSNNAHSTPDALRSTQMQLPQVFRQRTLTDTERRLESELMEAKDTIETLKKILVNTLSTSKKRNLRRHENEDSFRVSKITRDIVWPKVKFAPEKAWASLAKNSIYDIVISNCNLKDAEDELLFWCNNKDVVKDSLHQHRSNVTSRIKVQFKKGLSFLLICVIHKETS